MTSTYIYFNKWEKIYIEASCLNLGEINMTRMKTVSTSTSRQDIIQFKCWYWWFVLIRFQASNVCRLNPVESYRALSALERIYMVSTLEFITYNQAKHTAENYSENCIIIEWRSQESLWCSVDPNLAYLISEEKQITLIHLRYN